MPRVDEKWGLVVCPEHLIANGVREEASSRSCRIFRVSRHETVRGGCCCREPTTYDEAYVLCFTGTHGARCYLSTRVGPVGDIRLKFRRA